MSNNPSIIIIGSGFAGLSSACYLAKEGIKVTILEKNQQIGGRARVLEKNGFRFDMGPSWYWMPDVFERFFGDFGKKVSDFYELQKLDPAYRMFFSKGNFVDLPANLEDIFSLFEKKEINGKEKLENFLKHAEFTYQKGMQDFVNRPGKSLWEFMDPAFIVNVFKSGLLQSYGKEIDKKFKNPELRQLLKFPVLFLGASPENTPNIYSLMAWAQFALGTWYPKKGMNEIVKGMQKLALELGVQIRTETTVKRIYVENDKASKIEFINSKGETETLENFEFIVSGADYAHTETLLPAKYRRYNQNYWRSRTMSPSSLIFYLGISKKLKNLEHHNLFFDTSMETHIQDIYEQPEWPEKPLFYLSCPSITDPTVAPANKENIFILIPVASEPINNPYNHDLNTLRQAYLQEVIGRVEKLTDQEIEPFIEFSQSYAHKEFIEDYNSLRGNAYGLANTLGQTAVFKPKIRSKVKNLIFCGQLTVPGPGVPPTLISGKLAANEILNR